MTVMSNKFVQLRDVHHREKAEDYVEMIQELVEEQGEARLIELANQSRHRHKIVYQFLKEVGVPEAIA